jgi:hypothetical protein
MVAYSPLAGLYTFAAEWTTISKELLLEKPWNFEKHGSAPQGAHKAITDLSIAALFSVAAARSDARDTRMVSRGDLWREWLEEDLRPHGMTIEELRKINGAHAKAVKRVKAQIARDMSHLVFFELFDYKPGGVYQLTAKGLEVFKRLENVSCPVE